MQNSRNDVVVIKIAGARRLAEVGEIFKNSHEEVNASEIIGSPPTTTNHLSFSAIERQRHKKRILADDEQMLLVSKPKARGGDSRLHSADTNTSWAIINNVSNPSNTTTSTNVLNSHPFRYPTDVTTDNHFGRIGTHTSTSKRDRGRVLASTLPLGTMFGTGPPSLAAVISHLQSLSESENNDRFVNGDSKLMTGTKEGIQCFSGCVKGDAIAERHEETGGDEDVELSGYRGVGVSPRRLGALPSTVITSSNTKIPSHTTAAFQGQPLLLQQASKSPQSSSSRGAPMPLAGRGGGQRSLRGAVAVSPFRSRGLRGGVADCFETESQFTARLAKPKSDAGSVLVAMAVSAVTSASTGNVWRQGLDSSSLPCIQSQNKDNQERGQLSPSSPAIPSSNSISQNIAKNFALTTSGHANIRSHSSANGGRPTAVDIRNAIRDTIDQLREAPASDRAAFASYCQSVRSARNSAQSLPTSCRLSRSPHCSHTARTSNHFSDSTHTLDTEHTNGNNDSNSFLSNDRIKAARARREYNVTQHVMGSVGRSSHEVTGSSAPAVLVACVPKVFVPSPPPHKAMAKLRARAEAVKEADAERRRRLAEENEEASVEAEAEARRRRGLVPTVVRNVVSTVASVGRGEGLSSAAQAQSDGTSAVSILGVASPIGRDVSNDDAILAEHLLDSTELLTRTPSSKLTTNTDTIIRNKEKNNRKESPLSLSLSSEKTPNALPLQPSFLRSADRVSNLSPTTTLQIDTIATVASHVPTSTTAAAEGSAIREGACTYTNPLSKNLPKTAQPRNSEPLSAAAVTSVVSQTKNGRQTKSPNHTQSLKWSLPEERVWNVLYHGGGLPEGNEAVLVESSRGEGGERITVRANVLEYGGPVDSVPLRQWVTILVTALTTQHFLKRVVDERERRALRHQ